MLATATAADYRRTLQILIERDACDAILAIFVPALSTSPVDVAAAIRSVAERAPMVAIAAVVMTEELPPASLRSERAQVPGNEFPEDAARAVALAAKHGRWRARPERAAAARGGDQPEQAAAIISEQLADEPGWMQPDRLAALLAWYGIPAPVGTGSGNDGDAVQLVVGVVTDVNFGPVLACAAGGDAGELLKDVAVRITPVSEPDAHEMVRSLKTYPLLDGYGGRRPADVGAVEDVLLRASAMVERHPETVELDFNPLLVHEAGATVGGARVRVESRPPPAPMPSLRA
jgi:acyl-CoA synthetase (NDP forming)